MRLSTISYEQMVYEFMMKYKQPVRLKPEIPTPDELTLRRKLIGEEAIETEGAILQCRDAINNANFHNKMLDRGEAESLIIEVADGLADILYVTFGTALSFGIPMEAVFSEVHRSNMTKPVLGHDKVGQKVQKGDYSRPQLGVIIKLGMR